MKTTTGVWMASPLNLLQRHENFFSRCTSWGCFCPSMPAAMLLGLFIKAIHRIGSCYETALLCPYWLTLLRTMCNHKKRWCKQPQGWVSEQSLWRKGRQISRGTWQYRNCMWAKYFFSSKSLVLVMSVQELDISL